jgi:hypothetical protein
VIQYAHTSHPLRKALKQLCSAIRFPSTWRTIAPSIGSVKPQCRLRAHIISTCHPHSTQSWWIPFPYKVGNTGRQLSFSLTGSVCSASRSLLLQWNLVWLCGRGLSSHNSWFRSEKSIHLQTSWSHRRPLVPSHSVH